MRRFALSTIFLLVTNLLGQAKGFTIPSSVRVVSSLSRPLQSTPPPFTELRLAGEVSSEPLKEESARSRIEKIKSWLSGGNNDDGLTGKQRLAKMGLAALLSYGWVSNMSYSISISLAWFIFSRQTNKSPLAPGQWKPFLAVYAGFFVFNNFIRPLRFGVAVGVTRYFNGMVNAVQEKLRVSKATAIAVVVFFANVVGTFAMMALGIALASLAAGVPVFPPK